MKLPSNLWNREYFGNKNFCYRIRPIQKDDKDRLLFLFDSLSEESRYLRFAHSISSLSNRFIEDVLELNYQTEMAFVASYVNQSKTEEIIGIARYVATSPLSCEFSVTVSDAYTKNSIGRNLMIQLITYASQQGPKKMIGYVLKNNSNMLQFIEKLNFKVNQINDETDFVEVSLNLS